MSVASQWKLKEKEAAAAAATSKTGIPGARGKTEASAKDVSGGEAVSGPMGFKGQVERSGKLDTAKPGPPQASKPGLFQASKPGPAMGISYGKQGVSKLPVGKDTLKTKEADAVHTKDGAVQLVGATPSSKIPVGAKDNLASVGGRKPFGAGLKKEEQASTNRSKAEDNKVKTSELKKDPAGGAKDSIVDPISVSASGDDGPLGPGRTKGLAGFWANQNDEVKTVKKKRLTAVEENLTPTVVENTPQLLEGVVRAQDPGEWKKPLQVEDGWTKNVVSSFQKRQQESYSKRAPISLVEDNSNEKSDATPEAEAAKVKVKDISQRLTRQQSEPTKQAKEKLVIDRSQGAIVLAENQPMEVDPDVVRSDDASKEEVVLEKGRTRNLLQLWKNTEVEYNTPKTSTHRYQGSKPAWILEIEAAKGNSPEYNDEGQPEENDTIEMNDESSKRATHYEERSSASEHDEQANDDSKNILLNDKTSFTPTKEGPVLKGNTAVETIQSLRPRTEEANGIKLEKIDVTFNKEISCEETPTTASLDVKEVLKILPEEMKPHSDVFTDDPLSFPDQKKTLHERGEAEKDVGLQKPSPIESEPILQTSEKDDQKNKLVTQQPALLSGLSNTALDKEEPSERARIGACPSPSTEMQPNELADVALNVTDAECIGVRVNKRENEGALVRNEIAICTAEDLEAIQKHDINSQGVRSIADDTSNRLTDDHVANLSSIQNTASLPVGFLDHSEKPELALHTIPDDTVTISQYKTNPERGEMTLMIEDHGESSDNEIFATPTKSVILTPLGSVDTAEQVERCGSETRERVENVDKVANESSFTEGALIDLHTESSETKREKLSLLSLDELLQIETHPNLDYTSSADNTPCLVPLSSPSTPEVNISSERSSGVFDSDSEKCTDWFSPQEESTLTTAKTETISTHDESEHSSGSLKDKTGDGNRTESKVEEANKADASQRSCRVM